MSDKNYFNSTVAGTPTSEKAMGQIAEIYLNGNPDMVNPVELYPENYNNGLGKDPEASAELALYQEVEMYLMWQSKSNESHISKVFGDGEISKESTMGSIQSPSPI